jgi:RNA polymerase sigma factor (sigma-70 family)
MDKGLRRALRDLTAQDAESRRKAMDRLARDTFEVFIRYLYRYLGNEADCEDVLEDVYAGIWENPDHLRNVTNWRQFLRTVYLYYMRGPLREIYRRRNRYLTLSEEDLNRLVAPELGVLGLMSQNELREQIQRMLKKLTVPERKCVQLWMKGASYRAIANELKTTVGAAKMRQFRTLLKLKAMFDDSYRQD